MKIRSCFLQVCLLIATVSYAKSSPDVFYIYQDKGMIGNHYIPSGWMGDYGDLKFNDADTTSPKSGRTDIKITYTGQAKQNANWAGIYWQHPANNWGETKGGGYDLTGYKRLTLWARGEKGGEVLSKFCVGGITGSNPDSDSVEIGPLSLSKDWQKFTIDLKGHDLKEINGGLCWAASRDDNPNGFTMYLDEIRFEK